MNAARFLTMAVAGLLTAAGLRAVLRGFSRPTKKIDEMNDVPERCFSSGKFSGQNSLNRQRSIL